MKNVGRLETSNHGHRFDRCNWHQVKTIRWPQSTHGWLSSLKAGSMNLIHDVDGNEHQRGSVWLCCSTYFSANFNFFFFFLLKLSAVCTFWIVLMCWYQKWFLKNKKTSLACISARKAIWKATTTTLPNTLLILLPICVWSRTLKRGVVGAMTLYQCFACGIANIWHGNLKRDPTPSRAFIAFLLMI